MHVISGSIPCNTPEKQLHCTVQSLHKNHVVSLIDRCNLYTTPGLTKYLFREAKTA